MDKKFKDYIEKQTPAPINQELIDDLRDSMESAIPEIIEAIRKREELASIIRREGKPLYAI